MRHAVFVFLLTVGPLVVAQQPGETQAASRPESGPASRPAAATRVYFVRHGESVGNVRGNDALPDAEKNKLTERGVKQAEDVAKRLRSLEVVALYSSPAARARSTADVIAAARSDGLKVVVTAEVGPLKEGVGPDGAPFPIRARVAAWQKGEDVRPPQGESVEDVRTRCVAFVQGLAAKHPQASVLVIAHGEVGAALLAEAGGAKTLDTLMGVTIVNTGVRVFDVLKGRLTYAGPLEAPTSR